MKLISENGMVTYVMRAGKDKVRSIMSLARAHAIIKSSKDVKETDNEIIVDDMYFFPADAKKERKIKTEDTENE